MITIQRYNPSPRFIWYVLHHVARDSKHLHLTDRWDIMKAYTDYFEIRFNIDSDYLMETMGKYAQAIT